MGDNAIAGRKIGQKTENYGDFSNIAANPLILGLVQNHIHPRGELGGALYKQ